MKKTLRYCLIAVFFTVILFALSVSVSAEYEPDGSTSVEYKFDAAECNRTLIVDCVDENGMLLKKVQFQTKRGEETSASFCLYGYEVVGFESTQGLWETCTLSWASSNRVEETFFIINYYFRTGLSQDTVTATATMRKSEDITVKTRHYLRTDYGIEHNSKWFWGEEVDECIVSYGEPFTSSAKDFAGHYLLTGYPTQIEGTSLTNGYPPLISGNFSYTLIENDYVITDITDWMDWEVVDDTLKE